MSGHADTIPPDELADGFALWQEHKPQTAEDWSGVAKRCAADPDFDLTQSSPVFGGAVLVAAERQQAIDARDAAKQRAEEWEAQARDLREQGRQIVDEAKEWQAEWTKVIKRERALRVAVKAARSFVDDDEWQANAEAALGEERLDRLRAENTMLRREVRYLRRRVLRLTCSRDYWKQECERWKWGALR